MDRRDNLKLLSTFGLSTYFGFDYLSLISEQLLKRKIASSNTLLPIVGLGTWQTFDAGQDKAQRDALMNVLDTLVKKGATLVDSSPMYGSSESVVGDLAQSLSIVDELFMATKVWTSGKQSGIKQMEQSMNRMKKQHMDLMQVHNLVDWKTHLNTLQDWKSEGRIKHIGITHYQESAYSRIEHIMKNYPIDFVQFNYSIKSREAEKRLLPFAIDKGISVIINGPYESGNLFRTVKNKSLPAWSSEFDCHSWGQFFLKYILSNEAVTCVIPGTSKVNHLIDNLGAGVGRLPSAAHRKKMIDFLN